ncbi:hypothetical protein ABDK00_013820 [Niabella insulamsoli]|uniref:hypothetical protein n=1 Tax=Niabella insulamsoli TaxID=3144874 RepID=UPI0031FD3DDF
MNYFLPALLFSVFSCSEEKEIFETDMVSEYMPLQVGKTITYRLDSTVFTRGGSTIETYKYQVRHTVISEESSGNGSTSFFIKRDINNETASGSWTNNGSYTVQVFDKKIEIINDNLRVTTLQAPLKQGFTWKGNSQLPDKPYEQLFEMSAGESMNDWDFTLSNSGTETIENQSFQNVWTVEQHHNILNIPPTNNTSYGEMEVSTEKYAKGIGLVFKNFQLYEYQGPNAEVPAGHYTGFGIKMWMIADE